MNNIATYVFFDIETTGLPDLDCNRTKITEFAFVACSKVELTRYQKGKMPRVQHKLTVCVYPEKRIEPESTKITGLDNYNLEHVKVFTKDTGELIKGFFKQLQAPICLVAHNGFNFDYPIFRKQLDKVDVSMEEILCVDSLEIFREIDDDAAKEAEHKIVHERTNDLTTGTADGSTEISGKSCSEEPLVADTEIESTSIEALLNCDIRGRQRMNEKTPSLRKIKAEGSVNRLKTIEKFSGDRVGSKSKRALFPSIQKSDVPTPAKKRISFKLVDIYTRLHGVGPAVAHNAEEDAANLLKCVIADKEKFIEKAEKMAKDFMAVKPLGTK